MRIFMEQTQDTHTHTQHTQHEVLHVVVAVFLWTDVKVTGERGHCDDIINVLGMRDVVRKASIHHSLEKE